MTVDPIVQLAELAPSDSQNNDWFGISVAVSGNTVVVGSFDLNTEQFGSAYVFVKPSNGWANMIQTAKLTSSDGGSGFGTSVAVSGNTIVVGAANPSNFGAPTASPGAAYVFVKPAGGWADMTESAKLTASDGADGDAFGNSVSISGNAIAVGAFFVSNFSGKAYVFVKPSSGWAGNLTQTAELSASDSSGLLDYFGSAVSVSGKTVAVGSSGHNNFQGAVYVFVEPPTGWTDMTQTAELSASDGRSSDDLGFSAAISGNTIVAGAPSAHQGSGAAYIFTMPVSGWVNGTETAELHVPPASETGGFAQSVGIFGNVVIVGSPGSIVNGNQNQGSAFAFVKPATGWHTTFKPNAVMAASDGGANDGLGVSVSVSGTTFVAGATKSNKPGEAYVFGP